MKADTEALDYTVEEVGGSKMMFESLGKVLEDKVLDGPGKEQVEHIHFFQPCFQMFLSSQLM